MPFTYPQFTSIFSISDTFSNMQNTSKRYCKAFPNAWENLSLVCVHNFARCWIGIEVSGLTYFTIMLGLKYSNCGGYQHCSHEKTPLVHQPSSCFSKVICPILCCVNLTYYEPPNFPLQISSHSECEQWGNKRRVNRWANIRTPPLARLETRTSTSSNLLRFQQGAQPNSAPNTGWNRTVGFCGCLFLKTERLEMLSRGALSLAEKFPKSFETGCSFRNRKVFN